jgi:hypothetical protein
VIEEGWLQIPRQQVDKKSIKLWVTVEVVTNYERKNYFEKLRILIWLIQELCQLDN